MASSTLKYLKGNFMDGKRLLKLGINHLPQTGIQRLDHIKLIFKKTEKIILELMSITMNTLGLAWKKGNISAHNLALES